MKTMFFINVYRVEANGCSKVVRLTFETEEEMNAYIASTFNVDVNNAIIKFDVREQADYCESEVWFFEAKGFQWRINITIK